MKYSISAFFAFQLSLGIRFVRRNIHQHRIDAGDEMKNSSKNASLRFTSTHAPKTQSKFIKFEIFKAFDSFNGSMRES